MAKFNFKEKNPELVVFLTENVNNTWLTTQGFLDRGLTINFAREQFNFYAFRNRIEAETERSIRKLLSNGATKVVSKSLHNILMEQERNKLPGRIEMASRGEIESAERFNGLLMWKYCSGGKGDDRFGYKHLKDWAPEDWTKNIKRQQGATDHTKRLKESGEK
jgi:hypothetical protein